MMQDFVMLSRKASGNFQIENFYFSHLYKKMLLWGLKNTLKFNVLVSYSHMYVFDPPFVILVISGWIFCVFSPVSTFLYLLFLLFIFYILKQALRWKLLIFFYYCLFDPLGQIQSRNFLLIFICAIAVHQTQPTHCWRHFKLLNLVRFLWVPVTFLLCWRWAVSEIERFLMVLLQSMIRIFPFRRRLGTGH